VALESAQESRAQKPTDLLHSRGNLSELLTCNFFCRLAELQSLNICDYFFSCLTHCTYISNSTVKGWL